MPARVQQSRRKGWRKPPDTVCVSRPGRWGNPFPAEGKTAEAHAECVAAFRRWVMAEAQSGLRAAARRELRGKNLACYCAPGVPCHADVLLEIANGEE